MSITTITKLKEWESMLGGPHPVSRSMLGATAADGIPCGRWQLKPIGDTVAICRGAQVAVLFTDSSLGEVRNFSVLDRALHDVAQHHPEKVDFRLMWGFAWRSAASTVSRCLDDGQAGQIHRTYQ